jgi:hypothetical protein
MLNLLLLLVAAFAIGYFFGARNRSTKAIPSKTETDADKGANQSS